MTAPAAGKTPALLVTEEGWAPAYSAGWFNQTLFSTSAAVLVEVIGSATKVVRVKRIKLFALAATKFYADLTLLRCTGASAGTPAAQVAGKRDSGDGPATAVVNIYTAAAAAGAGAVVSGFEVLALQTPAAATAPQRGLIEFTPRGDKPWILRGTGDVLQVFNNTTAVGAGVFGGMVEWEEDNN